MDPDEIPAPDDVARLGQAVGGRRWTYELMVNFAAYSGLRWGELIALTADRIDHELRQVAVDRKIIEVRGHLYLEPPKGRKRRHTIYPHQTPAGYPLAQMVAIQVVEVRREQAAGRNPEGIMFPTPKDKYWRSSNFNRRVLKTAFLAAGVAGRADEVDLAQPAARVLHHGAQHLETGRQ